MQLLDLIRGSKIGEKIVAEQRAATYVERQALIEQRERERVAADAACERLAREADTAAASAAEAEAAWKRAQTVAQEARNALIARDRLGKTIIARLDMQLERGADPEIDALFAALEREFDQGRHHSADSPAMRRHREGLRQAQAECGELKLAAVPDVGAALEEIRARIPSKFEAAA